MAGLITVGGLATGLDTNSIIDQLLKIEHRPIDLLQQDIAAAQATQTSVGTVGSKLAAIKQAADAVKTVSGVLVRRATSSDESVLTVAAGAGATPGSVSLTVAHLAEPSVAGATVGLESTTSTVASGVGSLQFQVGSGTVETVSFDASTTLQELADAINALDAGVVASTVNLGTSSAPDYRLQLASRQTGAASSITIVRDDTALGVQTVQTGQDASFTVAGFSGTFARESNTFSDVLPGVTISLKHGGTATVTVDNDTEKIVGQVKQLVTAFNDLVTFVAGESSVTESKDKSSVAIGSLATDITVRRLTSRLHDLLSEPFGGASGRYVNLSSLGIATQRDGTLLLDQAKLEAALADDPEAAAEVLAGNDAGTGVAADLSDYIAQATGAGGPLAAHTQGLDDQVRSLQDQIDDGERRLGQVETDLRQQFAALESLVSTLKQQGDFLTSAFQRPAS